MEAWVIREAGGPEQFRRETLETPQPREGWALIRVRAFELEELVEAHKLMDANQAGGKIVVRGKQ